MSNVYGLDGKRKVIFTENIELGLTYKDIMKIVIANATEDGCEKIFTNGGINMCPFDVFEYTMEDELYCEDNGISCTECWTRELKKLVKK